MDGFRGKTGNHESQHWIPAKHRFAHNVQQTAADSPYDRVHRILAAVTRGLDTWVRLGSSHVSTGPYHVDRVFRTWR